MKRIAVLTGFLLFTLSMFPQSAAHKSAPGASEPKSDQAADAMTARIVALEKQIATLQSSNSFLSYLVTQKRNKYDSIQLDPSDHNFQQLDGSVSTFLVILEDASPYLNGYRMKLSIGNPSNATFSNVSLKIRWGNAYDFKSYDKDKYEKWQNSIKEKEITLTDDLKPGAWNTVTVDLVPCAASETGFLELSMKTPSVVLHKN